MCLICTNFIPSHNSWQSRVNLSTHNSLKPIQIKYTTTPGYCAYLLIHHYGDLVVPLGPLGIIFVHSRYKLCSFFMLFKAPIRYLACYNGQLLCWRGTPSTLHHEGLVYFVLSGSHFLANLEFLYHRIHEVKHFNLDSNPTSTLSKLLGAFESVAPKPFLRFVGFFSTVFFISLPNPPSCLPLSFELMVRLKSPYTPPLFKFEHDYI